ncbi:MAG: DUF983 domain-containing protein [Bacteroidota bacterium]
MNTLKKKQIAKGSLFMSIMREKCPNCGKGDVYAKKTRFLELPVMKDNCEVCHYHFDREPGYFLGAMYISYGLAVLQGILTFVLLRTFLPKIDTIWVVLIILAVISAFSMKNYKLSRIIYIHIFPF